MAHPDPSAPIVHVAAPGPQAGTVILAAARPDPRPVARQEPARMSEVYIPPGTIPVAPPVAPARPSLGFAQVFALALLAVATFLGHDLIGRAFPSNPAAPAATDFRKLAQVYGPEQLAAFGDGCLDAGSAVGAGRTMGEAQKALQDRFQTSRTAAFMVRINPELTKVIAPGAEPRDAAQRAEVASFFTDLGHACKGTK